MASWLQQKYLAMISPRLQGLVKKTSNTWNMRCPYCGDSAKNKSKKRGYLFEKSGNLIYKCHNCGIGKTFNTFLKDNGGPDIHSQYVMETLFEKDESKTFAVVQKRSEAEASLRELHGKRLASPAAKTTEMLFCQMLQTVADLPEDHEAKVYLRERFVPKDRFNQIFWIDDVRDIGQISEKARESLQDFTVKESRIVIPAWNEHGRLIGMTCRDITGVSKLRYLAFRVTNEDLPLIYGHREFDATKRGYIVEGPIDSFFLPNCIAVGGSDFAKITDKIPKDSVTLIFDNQPMNREVVKNYEKYIAAGYRVFIWPKTMNWMTIKDINDLAKAKETLRFPENMAAVIEENSFTGLTAMMHLARWEKGN